MHYLGDIPEQLSALEEVFIQAEPEGTILQGPLRVSKISHHKGQVFLLSLKEIQNRSEAESLAKSFVAIPRDEAPELPEETYYVQDLIGFVCKNAEGEVLGKVKHMVQGHQDILVIETPEQKEHWVPFVYELVPEVDVKTREMLITPPEGLFDL